MFLMKKEWTKLLQAEQFQITSDSIAYCPSGLYDPTKNIVLSYLHKAIKPVNQLRMIEDSVVIYRISRP